jgi:hypothetical protein
VTRSQADDDFTRILRALPRQDPPGIPVESLLRRLAWRRVRIAALCILGLAGALVPLLLPRSERKPPVNLDLRIVDVRDPVDVPPREPPELNLP